MAVIDDIKATFKQGSALVKIIYINIAVFLIVNLTAVFLLLLGKENAFSFLPILAVSSDINVLLLKPWTLFTYMFYHEDLMHILFNLVWFFWFGKIFLEYLDAKKLVGLYILGGLSGAFLFLLFFNFFPVFQPQIGAPMLGASAAIMAIVIAISFYVPNYEIYLLFFGRVKLKYIALATIVIDIIMIRHDNAGGHIAHLGGALYGYLFITQYKKGNDISKVYTRLGENVFGWFKRKPKMNVSYKRPTNDLDYNKIKIEKQKEMDRILDKIAKGGYDSLSKDEKDFLFKSSQ
jgi:membrane associated rhomboid family serine protease